MVSSTRALPEQVVIEVEGGSRAAGILTLRLEFFNQGCDDSALLAAGAPSQLRLQPLMSKQCNNNFAQRLRRGHCVNIYKLFSCGSAVPTQDSLAALKMSRRLHGPEINIMNTVWFIL